MTDALRQEQQIGTQIAEELNRTACLLLQAVNDEDIPPEGLHEKIVTYTSRLRGIIDDFGLTESPGILSLTLRQFDATTRKHFRPQHARRPTAHRTAFQVCAIH